MSLNPYIEGIYYIITRGKHIFSKTKKWRLNRRYRRAASVEQITAHHRKVLECKEKKKKSGAYGLGFSRSVFDTGRGWCWRERNEYNDL